MHKLIIYMFHPFFPGPAIRALVKCRIEVWNDDQVAGFSEDEIAFYVVTL